MPNKNTLQPNPSIRGDLSYYDVDDGWPSTQLPADTLTGANFAPLEAPKNEHDLPPIIAIALGIQPQPDVHLGTVQTPSAQKPITAQADNQAYIHLNTATNQVGSTPKHRYNDQPTKLGRIPSVPAIPFDTAQQFTHPIDQNATLPDFGNHELRTSHTQLTLGSRPVPIPDYSDQPTLLKGELSSDPETPDTDVPWVTPALLGLSDTW
jgi:hypothetical protein